MRISKRTQEILNRLDSVYTTEVTCSLNYSSDYELLVATILSAQCTDERVNVVTKDLFKKYPTLETFANADIIELESDVKSTGFYKHKAAHIKGAAIMLLTEHKGNMPNDINELTRLPGVGRKTANVIISHIFNEPGIVVDTHVKRISQRLSLTKETDPVKIEFDLQKKIPKDHWSCLNSQLITMGRTICISRSPRCEECFLNDLCKSRKK